MRSFLFFLFYIFLLDVVQPQTHKIQPESIITAIDKEFQNRAPNIKVAKQLKSAMIVMSISEDIFFDISKFGLLNFHEVGETGGDFDVEKRLRVEEKISSLNLSSNYESVKTVLPKYAFVYFNEHAESVSWNRYGNIYLVFNEDVKNRSTWTPFDSFELDEMNSNREQLLKSGQVNTFKNANSIDMRGTYFEAQIWGKLTLSDVKEIVVKKYFFSTGDNETTPEDLISKLAVIEAGIKITMLDDKQSDPYSTDIPGFKHRKNISEEKIDLFLKELIEMRSTDKNFISVVQKTKKILKARQFVNRSCKSLF
jgi:hypothetical protein